MLFINFKKSALESFLLVSLNVEREIHSFELHMVLWDFQVFADEPGFLHSTHFLISAPNPLISCLHLFKYHLGMELDQFSFI